MSAFVPNRDLSKKELWCEIDWRRACFADTLSYLSENIGDDDSFKGVLGILRESFSDLQTLIEIVQHAELDADASAEEDQPETQS